jgi:hypothetical protein
MLEAVQQGNIETVLGSGTDVQDVGGSGLSLDWTIAQGGGAAVQTVSFRVLDSGQPAAGAEVVVRGVIVSDGLELARGVADSAGTVELSIPLTEEVLARGAVMVQAKYNGKSATRKLRVKR